MRKNLAVLFLILAGALAHAQTTGTISANSQCVGINASGGGTVVISVSGTSGGAWSATLQPEVAIAGQPTANTTVYPHGSTTSQSTITANGVYTQTISGVNLFQVCSTAYVSGSATIALTLGQQSSHLGSGGGAVSTITGGVQGETVVGKSTTALANSPAKLYCSQFTGATADLQIKACLAAAISTGIYNVVVDVGGGTIAASPFTGNSAFHGYIEIEPGQVFTCTVLPCWPQPTRVVTEFLLGVTGAGEGSAGSVFEASGVSSGVMFCIGSTNGTSCPPASGTISQFSLINNPTCDAENLQAITCFENWVGEEGSGFLNANGLKYGWDGVCADLGGAGVVAINSSFNGFNCSNPQGTATRMTAIARGIVLNSGGVTGLLPRIGMDFTVSNSCQAAAGSCVTGGVGNACAALPGAACVNANDDIQICGAHVYIAAAHLEYFARAGINLGLCAEAGTDTAVNSGDIEIHSVSANVAGTGIVTIQPNATAAVTNVSLFHILNETTSGTTINDGNNTNVVSSAGNQAESCYITGNSGAVLLDCSGTNVSTIVPTGGSTSDVQYKLGTGAFGGSANFTFATTSGIFLQQGANNTDALQIQRFTNSAPTGNFLNLLNASAASVFNVDVSGNATGLSYSTSGTNGGINGAEGTGAGLSAAAGHDLLYPDSSNHCWHANLNNSDVGCVGTASNTVTLTNKSLSEDQLTGAAAAKTLTEGAAGDVVTRADVETGNLTAGHVITDLNSTNNNTNIGAIIGATGTSTGEIGLLFFDVSGTGDILRGYTGGSVAAGVYTVGTLQFHVTSGGAGLFGSTAVNPTTGTAGGVFAIEGTAPTGASTNYGFYNDSTLHCFDIINQTTNQGCGVGEASIIGANVIPKAIGTTPGVAASSVSDNGTTVSTAEPLQAAGLINVTTPIRDETRFVLVSNMTAVATAGVNIGSTGASNVTFSWPVTAANWYDMECKLPTTFAATSTVKFQLVSISGSVTISNVNSETMGDTGAAAVFQDLATIAGTTLATSVTPVTGAPGASEMITYSSQFLTSHAGNIGLEFVANGSNNITMLLGGECGLTQIN